MSFRFTIGRKIGTGFGMLIFFIIVVFGATFLAVNNGIETFEKNDKTSNQLINVLTPSKEYVSDLKAITTESRQLAGQWLNEPGRNDVKFKLRFKEIIEKDIPSIQESVANGILSYEKIVLFYLYRIRKFESNNELALHSIITLNLIITSLLPITKLIF